MRQHLTQSQLPLIAMPFEAKPLPPAAVLWDRYSYNPLTGELFSSQGALDAPSDSGYKRVVIQNSLFPQHRVIWKWVTGKDPQQFIDHINQDKKDNRWWNLRDVPCAVNMRNRKATKLTRKAVQGIKARIAAGDRAVTIGADYGVSRQAVNDIMAGRTWADV